MTVALNETHYLAGAVSFGIGCGVVIFFISIIVNNNSGIARPGFDLIRIILLKQYVIVLHIIKVKSVKNEKVKFL